MGFLSFLGCLSPAHINLHTLLSGAKKIGEDGFGNVYYQGKPLKGYKRPRRWVMYKGKPEASSVPPEWHGWLHHQSDVVPSEGETPRREWQVAPQANMTGTNLAYRPPGHILEGGQRGKATGDYEAWNPNE